jgi:hypothetical protein
MADEDTIPGLGDLFGMGFMQPTVGGGGRFDDVVQRIAPMGVMPATRRISIEQARQELARVMAAKGKDIERFHPVSGNVRMKTPFSELTSTTRPTGSMLPDRPLSAEDLYRLNATLLPLYGDRTMAGQTLTHINDVPLTVAQKLGGGGRFQQENPGRLWASEQGRITNLANRVREEEKASGGAPVVGVHVAMGPASGDFSRQTTAPLLQQLQEAKITRKAAKEFADEAASEWGITNWPKKPERAYEDWLPSAPGGQRADLAKVMQKAKYQLLNFPNVAAVRKAITEPELMHVPTLTSGMSVGRFAPGGQVVPEAGTHGDYSTDILGEHLGNMGQVPFSVMFPDFMRTRPPGEQIPNTARTVELKIPAQLANQQWLDNFMRWQEARRR